MLKHALLALAVLGVFPAVAADQPTPHEMVLLTVGGDIANTNRGPLDAKRDSLFAHKEISFNKAYQFDRAMLLGLKQGTVRVQPPEFAAPANFTGPLLKDVLAIVGAARAKVFFVAVDGYTGWLTPEDIDGSDWILALAADGVPLGLGQQGPIWLLNTRSVGEQASETQEAHWVWSIYYIRVGETP